MHHNPSLQCDPQHHPFSWLVRNGGWFIEFPFFLGGGLAFTSLFAFIPCPLVAESQSSLQQLAFYPLFALFKAYSHQKRTDGRIDQTNWWTRPWIKPMHCSLWECPQLNFNLSPNSFRNQKIDCGRIHMLNCGRINLSLVWMVFFAVRNGKLMQTFLQNFGSIEGKRAGYFPWHSFHTQPLTHWQTLLAESRFELSGDDCLKI